MGAVSKKRDTRVSDILATVSEARAPAALAS